LEAKICNLNNFLVNLLSNLGFYCLIILGEVSKSSILHFIVNVMAYFLIHVKDYEIACLTNPRSKELKLPLLCSSFARHLPKSFDLDNLLNPLMLALYKPLSNYCCS
jgi:hypothetical protein